MSNSVCSVFTITSVPVMAWSSSHLTPPRLVLLNSLHGIQKHNGSENLRDDSNTGAVTNQTFRDVLNSVSPTTVPEKILRGAARNREVNN
jgi:hypothetical protein